MGIDIRLWVEVDGERVPRPTTLEAQDIGYKDYWFDDRNYELHSALGYERYGYSFGVGTVGHTTMTDDYDDVVYASSTEMLFAFDWHRMVTHSRLAPGDVDAMWESQRASVLGKPACITWASSNHENDDAKLLWTTPYSMMVGQRWFAVMAELPREAVVYWEFF